MNENEKRIKLRKKLVENNWDFYDGENEEIFLKIFTFYNNGNGIEEFSKNLEIYLNKQEYSSSYAIKKNPNVHIEDYEDIYDYQDDLIEKFYPIEKIEKLILNDQFLKQNYENFSQIKNEYKILITNPDYKYSENAPFYELIINIRTNVYYVRYIELNILKNNLDYVKNIYIYTIDNISAEIILEISKKSNQAAIFAMKKFVKNYCKIYTILYELEKKYNIGDAGLLPF